MVRRAADLLAISCLVSAFACGERGAAPGPTAPAIAARSPIRAPVPGTARAPEPLPAPAPAPAPAECDDSLGGALARVSCDGTRVLVAHPVELHPDRPAPAEPTRAVLHAVSDLLQSQPEILFVCIEVYVGRDVGEDPEKRRAELAAAQRRADALLQYLWRKRGVSAERLEAVGYEHDARQSSGVPWPVVLRIVQRARR